MQIKQNPKQYHMLTKRKATHFVWSDEQPPIHKMTATQSTVSIQQAMNEVLRLACKSKIETIDGIELTGLAQVRRFEELCNEVVGEVQGDGDLLSDLGQMISCKLREVNGNLFAKCMLQKQLGVLVTLLNPTDVLTICELVQHTAIFDGSLIALVYEMLFRGYSPQTKHQVYRVFRLFSRRIDTNNVQKVDFLARIGFDQVLLADENFPILQEILGTDCCASRQFLDLFFGERFKSHQQRLVTILMKYWVKPTSTNMRHFIKLLVGFIGDQAVDSSTFWFLCQQASGLDKRLRKTALKALSQVRYEVEEDLKSLIQREKVIDQLFSVQDTNWMGSDLQWHSLSGLLTFALEDELSSIRKQAILCLINFAKVSSSFRKECRDMLFYMLNDENDDVRIMAINALKSVYDPFLINKWDLDIILFNLNEKILQLRLALYSLISKSQADCQQTLLLLIENICQTVVQYKEDFPFIAVAFRDFALRNKALIEENLSIILADRMNQEVDWGREDHILKILITRNSLSSIPETSSVPFYYLKHVGYLMDKYPLYFQLVESNDQSTWTKHLNNLVLTKTQARCLRFLQRKQSSGGRYANLFAYLKYTAILERFHITQSNHMKNLQTIYLIGLLPLYGLQLRDDQFESIKFRNLAILCTERCANNPLFEPVLSILNEYLANHFTSSFRERSKLYSQLRDCLQPLLLTKSYSLEEVHSEFVERQCRLLSSNEAIPITNPRQPSFKLTFHLSGVLKYELCLLQVKYGGHLGFHKLFRQDIKQLDPTSAILDVELQVKSTPSVELSLVVMPEISIKELLPSEVLSDPAVLRKVEKLPRIGPKYRVCFEHKY